jgi:hypothetical protein
VRQAAGFVGEKFGKLHLKGESVFVVTITDWLVSNVATDTGAVKSDRNSQAFTRWNPVVRSHYDSPD